MPVRTTQPAVAGGRRHHTELKRLLTMLSNALTTGDGKAAARVWEVPAFVLGDSMSIAVATFDQLAEFFAGARAQYNARGITDTRPEIISEDWISDDIVHVHVRWPYLDESKHEIGAEASDYTISRDAHGKLKIRVAVMRGVEGAKNTAGPS